MAGLLRSLLLLGAISGACGSSSLQIRGVSPSDQTKYLSAEFECVLAGKRTNVPQSRVNDEFCDCDAGEDEPGTAACSHLEQSKFHCENDGFFPEKIHTSRVDDGICDCCDGSDEALGSQCKNTCSAAAEVVRKRAEERLEVVRAGFAKRQAVINGKIADYFAAEQDSVSSKSKELEALTLLKERVVMHKEREELRERKYRLDVARQRQAESQSGTSEGGEEAHREQFSDAAEKEAIEALDFEGLDAIRIADEDAPVNTAEDERASEVLDTRMHSLKSFIELSDHTRVSLAEYLRMDHRPPPTKKFPKLDDQVTLPVAKSLREALREIEADINKLEKERGEKYEAAKADFGPDRAFFSLKDKCIEQRIEKYLYKFCAFGEVKQDKTKLGKWEGWVIDETSTSSTGEPYVGHTKMKYSRGQKCYKGPERSVIVHLECGIEDQIVSVDEPSTCIYEQEISDSRGGSPRSDLSVYTTGNAVTSLTVTNEFFNAVYDDFTATKEGDRVLLAAWEVSLITLKPDVDPTGVKTGFREVIAGVVERGASVNILGWSNVVHRTVNIKARDAINKIPKSAVNGARALYIFDDRVRTFTSSHHQKTMVIAANSSSASKDQPIAYVGGLEITSDRWDTIYHNNSALRDATNITFVRKGWIDSHLRIHGPAAKDVANNFLARWNSNYTPGDGLEDELLDFENPEYEDLPMLDYASSRTTASLGSHSVQIVRTFSCEYDHYKEFAPHGETSLFQARIKAIKNAKNYIYVEDQYFILVPELLDALLAVMPTIQRLVIVTNAQNTTSQATGYAKYFYNMVSPLLEKYPDKIKLYMTKGDLKVFVHSKLVIIDDVYLSVGSANWNRRSMTSDSELSASVVDKDTVEAPDGITVNKLARDFRIRKFVEMTGLRYDELDAMTFLEAADQMGKAAVDESTILQVLEPKKRIYFPIFTNFVREQIDPQDTCTTEG
ncbi:hypothetical protein BBP00_00003799 [Phytophthora kernoviae]|uniref:Glucosidase 2 subunit beta n=1 Tax=Phytophthora kernoviae TaxID=325452 RepID=A0A3F2RTH9_9STRA|nr:hypothetical protein BBP00_00003799 [Phytophthora kernoviae]